MFFTEKNEKKKKGIAQGLIVKIYLKKQFTMSESLQSQKSRLAKIKISKIKIRILNNIAII
jgi:hypothetical protein